MSWPARSARATRPPGAGELNGSTPPLQPRRRDPRWHHAIGGWRGLCWLAGGVAASVVIVWYIVFSPGESGSKAQWFFGAVVFGVALIALWQTIAIQRQAAQNAAESHERLRSQLAAAEERSARELALTRSLHQTEMEAQRALHRAEMEAQRELARVERRHLLERLQRQALVEVSRAVGAHTQMLALLWDEGARVLRLEDRDQREQAMNPIIERIAQVVNDFAVEIDNAHLLIEDEHLHRALQHVNEAAVMAMRVAEEVHAAVIDGHEPDPNPIPPVQRLMYKRATEARRLAWDLLRAGLRDSG